MQIFSLLICHCNLQNEKINIPPWAISFPNRWLSAILPLLQLFTPIKRSQQSANDNNSPVNSISHGQSPLHFLFVWEAGLSQQGRKDNHSFGFTPTKCEGFFCSQQMVFNLLYILFEKSQIYENKRAIARFVLFTSSNALYYCQLVWLYSVLIFSIGLYLKWHLFYFAKPSMNHQLYCSLESTATCTDVLKAFIARKIGSLVSDKNKFHLIKSLIWREIKSTISSTAFCKIEKKVSMKPDAG